MCVSVMDIRGCLKVAHTHGVPYLSPTQQLMELVVTLMKVNMHLLDQSPKQYQHWMRLNSRYTADLSCFTLSCQSKPGALQRPTAVFSLHATPYTFNHLQLE